MCCDEVGSTRVMSGRWSVCALPSSASVYVEAVETRGE